MIYPTDKELQTLKEAYDTGELPYCEYIETLIRTYQDQMGTDDGGNLIHSALIRAMYDMLRASQVHEWCGKEDEIYENIKRLLLSYVNIKPTYDGGTKFVLIEKEPEPVYSQPRMTPYEYRRAQVYATGNKWAIENFHAVHD